MCSEYILEMTGIEKHFPGVKALDGVNLKVKKGEVHALMGENGAGKSTLMKILNGIYRPDRGEIRLDGGQVKIINPNDAIAKGLAMIHQELTPVPNMTIAENIFLGKEKQKGLFADNKKMFRETKELLKTLDFDFNPGQKMSELSVSQMQIVEIAKAVSYNADIIIMDEPTSAITENEVNKLFRIILELTSRGVAVIYITHKMDEVFQIADQVTVLRDGKYIDSKPIGELTPQELVNMLVGRELKEIFPKVQTTYGDVLLEVRDLTLKGIYEQVSFTVRKGEILGVAGLVGAGRTEVFETVAGITKQTSGEIFLKGKKTAFRSPKSAIQNKVAIATEDRKRTGLCLHQSIKENIMISSYHSYFPKGIVSEKKITGISKEEMQKFAIKAPDPNQMVGNLSGGNQQKVVLAKVLLTNPDVVIFDEPTRGIDVGAKSEIYKLMSDLAKAGKGVIMISSEMPEILGMSDRIMVMCQGRVTGIIENTEELSQDMVFHMACGMK